MRFAPGECLGHYVIESELGAGGMGQVFRARDTRLRRPVAIKVLSSEIAGPMARHRFEREALAASALDRIRGSAPFIRFMNELKPVWEEYARRMQ
jgi:serine/threonine protein kinase